MNNIIFKGHETCETCKHLKFKPYKLSQYNGSACSIGFQPRENGYCKGKIEKEV